MEHSSFDFRQTKDQLIAEVLTRYPSLFSRWARGADIIQFKHSPWTKLSKSISQSRLALITTGGVHLRSQPPFDMQDSAGDPTFREIPADISVSDLTITHNYYNHSDADKDINIIFPIERLKDLERSKDIGSTNDRHFSFMGHIKDHHREALIYETAPRVAAELIKDGVDIVILTPA